MDKTLLYNRLTQILLMIQAGQDQEPEDKLLDVMDDLWRSMTGSERLQHTENPFHGW